MAETEKQSMMEGPSCSKDADEGHLGIESKGFICPAWDGGKILLKTEGGTLTSRCGKVSLL